MTERVHFPYPLGTPLVSDWNPPALELAVSGRGRCWLLSKGFLSPKRSLITGATLVPAKHQGLPAPRPRASLLLLAHLALLHPIAPIRSAFHEKQTHGGDVFLLEGGNLSDVQKETTTKRDPDASLPAGVDALVRTKAPDVRVKCGWLNGCGGCETPPSQRELALSAATCVTQDLSSPCPSVPGWGQHGRVSGAGDAEGLGEQLRPKPLPLPTHPPSLLFSSSGEFSSPA